MRVLTPSACCATLCAITSRVAISRHFAHMRERAGNGVIIRKHARNREKTLLLALHAVSRVPFHPGKSTCYKPCKGECLASFPGSLHVHLRK